MPDLADPDRHAYLAEVAAMMDDRTQRIGAFAADHALPWATAALGPVPEDPATRREWEKKASAIGAYREMDGYHHPADPPARTSKSHFKSQQRSTWATLTDVER